jgi:virulence factor Mce-like protein
VWGQIEECEIRSTNSPRAQLAVGADVRVAGISVGKVLSKSEDPRGNRLIATIGINPQYVPFHTDARAILRSKTLAGETYVEMTPGTRNAPVLRDGGTLRQGQVQANVQLDQVLNAFDAPTRRALQVWQQELGRAIENRGVQLNNVLGNLPGLAANADEVLSTLDTQRQALGELVRTSGVLFRVLERHSAGLHGTIVNSATVFAAAASQRSALQQAFEIFPTFLNETKATQQRVGTFAIDADPLVRALRAPLRDLAPTLVELRELAPNLTYVFHQLGPLITAARTGIPASTQTLSATRPVLRSLGPFLDQLNPVLAYLQLQSRLVSDFIDGPGGALNATTPTPAPGSPGHYLRQFGPTGLESAAIYRDRPANERGDAYPVPASVLSIPSHDKYLIVPEWDCMNTGAPGDGTVTYD